MSLTSNTGEDIIGGLAQQAVSKNDGIVARLGRVNQIGHLIACLPKEWIREHAETKARGEGGRI
jgi:hypothetical protein